MPGMHVRVEAQISDRAFQKLKFDPILPEQGALILIDPTHPAQPWAAGYVPGMGGTVPNLAAAQANAALGDVDVRPAAYNSGTADGSTIIRARTSKGGIRAKGHYFGMRPSEPMMDYLIANYDHRFYASIYSKLHQEAPANYQMFSIRSGRPRERSMAIMAASGGGLPESGDPRLLGRYESGPANHSTPGMTHHALGFKLEEFDPGVTGVDLRVQNQISLFGPYANSGTWDRTTYSFYLEDLTVSGRSYAEVLAIDKARYSKLFAPGGRYHGDV